MTLLDYMQFAAAHRPDPLIGRASMDGLLRAATALPAVHEFLLECPLGDTGRRIDLSILCRDPGDLSKAVSALAGKTLVPDYAGDWGPASPGGLWLEFDEPSGTGGLLDHPPATFVRFRPHREGGATVEGQARAMARWLAGSGWSRVERGFETLVACLPPSAVLGHLGLMWSRPSTTLRLNLGGMEKEEVSDMLTTLGLPTNALLGDLLELAYADACRPVLCLDVREGVLPRVGFELFPGANQRRSEFWRGPTRRLVDSGLCSSPQSAAIDAWSRTLTPADAGPPWPADVIRGSLLRRPTEFSTIWLAVNHLKLVGEPDRGLSAKVYLSVAHGWSEFEPPELRSPEAT